VAGHPSDILWISKEVTAHLKEDKQNYEHLIYILLRVGVLVCF
jgi:hypothetical protein